MKLKYWCKVIAFMLIMATSVFVHQEGLVVTSMAIAMVAVFVFVKAFKELDFTND